MTQEVIVFEGSTKNGEPYLIRYPLLSDAEAMLAYINSVSAEQTFINMQGEQKTLKEEQEFLEEELEKITKRESTFLLVTIENIVIGVANVRLNRGASAHVGTLSIHLASTFRGKGIGSNLLKHLLEEVQKNLPKLRIISLNSFEDNPPARKLYERFGFIEFGKLPEGLFRKGEYSNLVYMYKKLK